MKKIIIGKPFKLSVAIILIIFFSILLINMIPAADATHINDFITDEVRIVAKSGAGNESPSCIASSFAIADYYGADVFEVGIVLSADDEFIIADTNDLEYYTGVEGLISEKTFEELKALNFAYNFTNDNGTTYPYRGQNIQCFTFDTLLSTYKDKDYIINIVQTSDEGIRCARYVLEYLREQNMVARVVFKCEDRDVTDYIRDNAQITTYTSARDTQLNRFRILTKFKVSNLYATIRFEYVEIKVSRVDEYTQRIINEFNKRNVAVYITQVNSVEDMEKALSCNPNGIVTTDLALLSQEDDN